MINHSNRDYIEKNFDLKNGKMSCGIGLIKMLILSQLNETRYFNDMDLGVENGDVRGRFFK